MRALLFILIFSVQLNSAEKVTFDYGVYEVVGEHPSFCTDGMISLVGENKNPTLQIGGRISLGPLNDKQIKEKTQDGCLYTRTINHLKNKLIQKTKVESCPKDKIHLEQVVTQTLSKQKNNLIYEIEKAGKKEKCVFQKWSQK